jgi:hypothetical protein
MLCPNDNDGDAAGPSVDVYRLKPESLCLTIPTTIRRTLGQ